MFIFTLILKLTVAIFVQIKNYFHFMAKIFKD